ncbi:MetQ/NlpA family ABC transporter substrate-binding protein [Streptomyces sp. TP-A0874]|uniref:MetQ/NlpA family ABC transporter substrate-binding protein n=1 Tax=Streptomyces sp. TP-A0874 TaxID=549819 RepID=UPI000853748A|nr:MetQ/NlpA family ABC transporter substrate-binding protein [Streptomyces sp. TP-A0874]
MRTPVKTTITAAAAAALALSLAACGSSDSDKAGGADPEAPLTVAASPTPHADILNYVKENLAQDAGLKLEVKEFTDYVTPNTALQNGEVDANFFQHKPYLDDFNKKKGTDIVPVVNVELEPLGLYSSKLEKSGDLRKGSTVALPNDATNGGRALQLLDEQGLIELKPGKGSEATLADVKDTKGLHLKELEAAQLPRSLDDVDAAVINGNYAIEAGLNPAEQALALESAEGNPYANFLAVKDGNEDDSRVRKLAELLNSDEVRKYIEKEFDGAIIPAFGAVGS